MQSELDTMSLGFEIRILGVNQVEQEQDNDLICTGRDIPWLQDTWEVLVWGSWHVEWRDVVILDQDNVKVGVYNLSDHDLSDHDNYETLKSMLIEAGLGQD